MAHYYDHGHGGYQQYSTNRRLGGGLETADDIYERFHNKMTSYIAGDQQVEEHQQLQDQQPPEGNCVFKWLRSILLVEAALFWGLFGYQYLVCSQRHECHMLMNTMRSIHEMPKATFYLTASSVFGGTAIALAAVTERFLFVLAGFVNQLFYGKLCSLSPKQAASLAQLPSGADQKAAAVQPDAGAAGWNSWYSSVAPQEGAEGQETVQGADESFSRVLDQTRQSDRQQAEGSASGRSNASFYDTLKSKCYNLLGNTAAERDQTPFQQSNANLSGLTNQPSLTNSYYGATNYSRSSPQTSGYFTSSVQQNNSFSCPVHGSTENNSADNDSKSNFSSYIQGVKAFLKQPFDFPESPDELRERRVARRQQATPMYDHQDRSGRYFTPPVLSRSPSVSSSSSEATTTTATYRSRR